MTIAASVWTAGADLADAVAEAVLRGFPLSIEQAQNYNLAQWTILVPTRRAARHLDDLLFRRAAKGGLVLPQIRPIGDVDEDELQDIALDLDVPEAVSKSARMFLLLTLIDQWATENPQLELAQDVAKSPSQCIGLATSLAELIDQIETEEVSISIDEKIFGLDLAEHRQSILSLLNVVTEALPQLLLKNKMMGQAARRNKLIRLEAARIRAGHVRGPIIAVGSTGTNPATRDLLAAIAVHPSGAVILPGFDITADQASWIAMSPNHPQHAMKMLLEELAVEPSAVKPLRPISPRAQFLSHVLRPAETTEKWHDNRLLEAIDPNLALSGVTVIDAADRHFEARAIAVVLRQTLETPHKTAALVTPDRDLAQRVTAELRRWNVTIDDSAGQPLLHFGRGQLLDVVMRAVDDDFAAARIVAILAHPQFTLGLAVPQVQKFARLFELVALRRDLPLHNPQNFAADLLAIKPAVMADRYAHAAIRAMSEADWEELLAFAQRLSSALTLLTEKSTQAFVEHIDRLNQALDMLAPLNDEAASVDQVLSDLFLSLKQDGQHHPNCTMARTIISLRWCLKRQPVRPVTRDEARLFIYGLPEARMMTADLMVLGGLNETIWPAAADPGPWINRSMRRELGLQQPERDIGITAHDFAQNMDHPTVVLSYAQRKGSDPLMLSRWLLRLSAVLQTKGMTLKQLLLEDILNFAQAIDKPTAVKRLASPRPTPPVSARLKQVSVSDVALLKRDPYAYYAAKLLRLRPLAQLGAVLEPRLKGMLFHDALAHWGKQIVLDKSANSRQLLLDAGAKTFAPYANETEVKHFWWPRFERMAHALVAWDVGHSKDVVARFVECSGKVPFTANGIEHFLTARADRIDVLVGGITRIYDYKTGAPPTAPQVKAGFNPQLTLEAAMVMRQGFGTELPDRVDDLIYLQIGGGRPPVKDTLLASKTNFEIATIAQRHFAGLSELMADFQNPDTPYLPRVAMFKDNEASDYDHLSRFAEWSLGGT